MEDLEEKLRKQEKEIEEKLRIQELEKKYSGMKMDQLLVLAQKEKVNTKGEKAVLVKRLVDHAAGKKPTTEQMFLEKAIMTWSRQDMRLYLNDMNKSDWGSKAVMTERIIGSISIDDALDITKEYKTYLAKTPLSKLVKERTNEKELDERKRKRDGKEVGKGDEEDTVGGEENIMEIDEENEEENGEKEEKKQTCAPRRRRVVDEEDEVMVDKVVSPEKKENETPPNVVDKTADKHYDCSSSAHEGNTLEDDEVMVEKVVTPVTENPNPIPKANRESEAKNDASSAMDEAGWTGGGDNDSVGTVKVDNIVRTRIGLMLTIPPSKEPDKKLCSIAQQWFKKMKDIDSKFTLIPWKGEDASKPLIRQEKKIPNLMSKMRVYLSRVQARSDGGKAYTDVFVQHTVPIHELKSDAEWFLQENGMGMFDKDLQVESVERKGWFLYSTPALDHKLLAEKITEEIGVPVALRWKYINTEKYEQLDRDERKKWMALHIEVATEDAKKASRGLARLYGCKSTSFPLGIRMRLVSEFREVKGNSIMMGKHIRLRVRQSSFLGMILGHPSDEIMLLDYIPKRGKRTLRSLIMSIQSQNDKTPGNLFHAVGKDWKGRIILNYLKLKKDEASMIADGLIPFLAFKYGDEVYEFFDPDAVVEKEDWFWDEDKKTIVNPLSKELDGLEAMDNDYDFSVAPTEEIKKGGKVPGAMSSGYVPPKTAAELAAARLNMVVTGGDEDSVSTLGNPLSPSRLRQSIASSLLPSAPGVAWGTGVSASASVQSMDTRLSTMEQTMQSLAVDMEKKFESSMEKFFIRMQASVRETVEEQDDQPPGGALAGGDNG